MRHLVQMKGVPEDRRDAVRAHASRRTAQLGRRLRRFTGESARLYLAVGPAADAGNGWVADLVFKLASGVTSARGGPATDPVEALDNGFDRMERKLQKRLEQDRRSRRSRDKHDQQQALREVGEALGRAAAEGTREAFDLLLRPRIDALRRTARRVLAIRRAEGSRSFGPPGVDDVINQTLLEAWSRYPHKDPQTPLDLWLTGILLEVVEEECARDRNLAPLIEALQDDVAARCFEDPDLDRDGWWWIQPEADDDILWEDLLPDDRAPDGFGRLSFEETHQMLLMALSELSPATRNAIVLYALEGYDLDEIKGILGLSVDQATCLIDEARHQLRALLVGTKDGIPPAQG